METIQDNEVTSGVPSGGGEFEALLELLKGLQVLRAIAAPTPECSGGKHPDCMSQPHGQDRANNGIGDQASNQAVSNKDFKEQP